MSVSASGFWKGFGNGFLSLIGLGNAYDPLGKKQAELNQKIAEFNSYTTESAYQGLVLGNKVSQEIIKDIQAQANLGRKSLDLVKEDIQDSIENINLFLVFLYILIFIICLYLMVKT